MTVTAVTKRYRLNLVTPLPTVTIVTSPYRGGNAVTLTSAADLASTVTNPNSGFGNALEVRHD